MDRANGGLWEGETQSTGVEDELRDERDGMGECAKAALCLHSAGVGREEEEKFLVWGHVAFDRCNWGVETCIHMHSKSIMSVRGDIQ